MRPVRNGVRMDVMQQVMQWLVAMVDQFGYFGLFFIGMIEAVPVPAELVVIPAGYLAEQGELNFALVLVASVSGTTCGATLNYWLARRFGRGLFLRFGRFVMLNDSKLAKLERFFMTHGPVSIFLGRLVPGVRHYLFLPAGLAAMPLRKFIGFTALGALIWNTVLVTLGYHVGKNEALVKHYLPLITKGAAVFIVVVVVIYLWRHSRTDHKSSAAVEEK